MKQNSMHGKRSRMAVGREVARIVAHGAVELDIDLPESAAAAFEIYYDYLKLYSQRVNLTAIEGVENIARLHFLDSLALLRATAFTNLRVIDVGSGAGFPGVPLKIAEPTIDLTLLDAKGKRVSFLSGLCAVLTINAACVHARAEEASQRPDMRECYDVALSRAVARLNVLCELCIPFVCVGGVFLSMKSVDSDDEIADARSAIAILGAELVEAWDYTIPGTEIKHRVIVIRKTSITPDVYPRRFAKIQNMPL